MSLTPCRDLQIGRSFSHSLGGVRRGNVGPFLSLRVLSRGQHALSLRFCSPLLLDLTAFMQSTPRGRVSILNKLPWSVAFVLRVCSEGWISKPVPRPQPTRILYPDISFDTSLSSGCQYEKSALRQLRHLFFLRFGSLWCSTPLGVARFDFERSFTAGSDTSLDIVSPFHYLRRS